MTTPPVPAEEIRKKRHPWAVLAVVGVCTLLSAMSASTVSLALPKISQELHITIGSASWIMLSYLLPVTVLLMLAGRASDVWGHRTVYLVGFSIFGFASLACGLADTFPILVAGRVLQGVGASMIMASGPPLLISAFPDEKRGQALGSLSTATYVGLTIGPPLGGWIVSGPGWRWIFLLNVPVMLLIVALGLWFLPTGAKRRARSADWPGVATFLFGLPLCLLAIVEGERWGWTSWPILGCAFVGLALLAAFFTIERRQNDPLLDLRLFRSKVFSGSVLSALGNYIVLFVPTILLPFCLMEGLRVEPIVVGTLLAAQPLVMAIVASPAGWLSDRIGTRELAVGGLLVLAVGILGLSTINAQSTHYLIAIWLGVVGLGTGIFISPNSSALMGSAPAHQQGIAAGIMALARSTGMMIGVAAGTAIYQAAGGATGRLWQDSDFLAQRHTYWVAFAVCLLAAMASAWTKPRGKTA